MTEAPSGSVRSHRPGYRGILASAALVAVLAVVPVALAKLGGRHASPFVLAATVRGLIEGRHVASSHTVLGLVVGCCVLLAWVAWAWTTACIVVEVGARSLGRDRARLPGSRTLQAAVACLVGTALSLVTVQRLPGPTAQRSWQVVAASSEGVPARQVRAQSGATPQDPDSAGSLRVLTDPASVALGQPLTPVAPACDVSSDDGVSGGTVPRAQASTYVVGRRDTLWSISASSLGSPLRWRELAAANYGRVQPDGRSLDRDHRLHPGWTLDLPAGREGVGVPDPEPVQELTHSAGSNVHGPVAASDRAQDSDARVVHRGRAAAPMGIGLLGAGIIEVVDRHRRVQQRHRRIGETIPMPRGPAQELERHLRSSADRSFAVDVDRGLRCLRSALVECAVAPVLERIEVDSELVTMTLRDAPDMPPGPASGDGLVQQCDHRTWTYVRDRGRDPGGRNDAGEWRSVPRLGSPALVTTGVRGDAIVLADLERFGTLGIGGPPVDCDTMARVVALELVTSPWAGELDLMLIGFGSELEHFAPVDVVNDPTVALGHVLRRIVDVRRQVDRVGGRSFADARWRDGGRMWRSLVVVCGTSVDPNDVSSLMDVADDPRTGLMVVAPADGGGPGATVDARTGKISLSTDSRVDDAAEPGSTPGDPVGVEGSAAGPRSSGVEQFVTSGRVVLRSEMAAVGELIECSTTVPSASDPVQGTGVAGCSPADAHVDTGRAEVEINVLGPVEIRGAAGPFTRAWAKELVVYLALHPDGASNDAWATALWPDRRMAASSLHSTASVARRALGRSADGGDHLPRSHGRLKLSDTVGTDWSRFVTLASHGGVESDRQALSLVRGRPFDGVRSADWPIVEGLAANIESAVVDVALRVADAEALAARHLEAERAARTGLLVSPFDERLYRVLLRCADAVGNPAGVEAVMSELLRVVADGVEPLESVHPDTLELYRTLSRRRTPVGCGRR